MATIKLTERQQEVQALVKDGKKPVEIGEALGITTNGVYQQLRRIREITGGAKGKPAAKKTAAKKTTAAKSGRSSARKTTPTAKPAATPAPAPAPVETVTAKPLTPLQAVRAHRDEVTASLKQAEQDVKNAQAVLARVEAARDKLATKVAPQVAQLDAAEAALQGKLALPEPTETAEAPAPVAAPEPATAPEPVAQPETKPEAAKPATAKPKGSSAAKKSTPKTPAKPKADAAATPEPTNQAEREATADPFGEDEALAEQAQAAQEPAEAPVPA